MPTKPNAYLLQLRDQISKTFNLDELRTLTFELLDWDELEGSRKTTRIQDLITQLAQNGRLEALVELLNEYRPRIDWPEVPAADQQKQDIRTAFPSKPLHQQPLVWVGAIVLLVLAGIFITYWFGGKTSDRIDESAATIIAANPTHTPVPTPTLTPIPSPTPLPFNPEAEGETLIIISKFAVPEGNADSLLYTKIEEAIEEQRNELNLKNVRIETERTVIDPELNNDEQIESATELGSIYNASLIIWGVETEAIVEFNFLNLKEPDFDAANVSVEDFQNAKLANPEAYGKFVVEDLPGQLAFLSFFSLGQAEYSRSNFAEAIVLIETAVSSLSDLDLINNTLLKMDKAFFRLGWLYQITDRPSVAINNYDQAVILNPNYVAAIYNRGLARHTLSEYETAIADYDRAVTLNPEYAEAFENRGIAYADLGEYELAIADFDQAITLNPKDVEIFYNRGTTYIDLVEYEQAIIDFNQAIALDPEFAKAFLNRGVAHYGLGRYEIAIADFNQAIILNPEEVLAYKNRGVLYRTLGEYELAIADFNQAIILDSEFTEAFYSRGLAYLDLGEYENAIVDYDQAIAINPEYVEALINRGIAYRNLGEFAQAITNYDQAIAINPEYVEALINRGIAYRNLGEFAQAITNYDQAIALNPEDADAFYNRGNAYYRQGEYAQAITDFDQAIALNPEFALAYFNRALSLLELEQSAEALIDLRTYLDLNPQSPQREAIENRIKELEAELEN